jgi:RNA polymerase sigma factor (sigma-70 family)
MTALATDSGRKTPARLAGSAILALQSDDRLVGLVRSGHERAFDAIVERYRNPLVRYCGRMLPDSRCEDAVQQAFINAHAALTSSDEPVQLKPWLFAITRNAALNILRQNGWNYEQIPADFDGVRRPDQIFEERARLERTVAALNELPERQRDALVMREFEGRSYGEIATALGANDGAVRQLLNRARVTLRNAAAALVPPPLVARAASLPPGDGRRVAEILGGFGAAGIAKAGATAVVAGTLVVGAVTAPLPIGEKHDTTRQKAVLEADPAPAPGLAAHDTAVANRASSSAVTHANRTTSHNGSSGTRHATPLRSERGHRQSGDDRRESSREQTRERSGSGDDRTRSRSGSDDSTSTSGSDDRSGSGSGSDDGVTTTTTTVAGSDDSVSGSSGPGSGTDDSMTSGSGTSGSGTSGSGTSGSGSEGPSTTTTTTTSSGSGSSGSDSGSLEPLDH